jgi:hypothetical protein
MPTARLALIALVCSSVAAAQSPGPGQIITATEFVLAPGGRALAQLRVGAGVQTLAVKGAWSQVAIDGWLHASVFGPPRDSFPMSVKSPNGALMRAAADRSAPVVALLEDGMALQQTQKTDQWAHVRRVGWVLSKTVKPGMPPALPPPPPPPSPATGVKPPAGAPAAASAAASATVIVPEEKLPGDVAVAKRTNILAAPTGQVLGTVDSATRLITGPSERGWVRVTLEGWVRQADLIPVDSVPISTISAADLRADPKRYEGQTVRWIVQVVAYQTADPLRKGLRPDEPYLLARGPGTESSILYLALPPSLMDMGRGLKPLSSVMILAKVRTGRSDPSGVPILDVQRIIQQR